MPQLTRKAANARVLQLEAQLRAAGGETRKNMRERIARLADEAKKAKEDLAAANKELREREAVLRAAAAAFEELATEGPAKELYDQHFKIWLPSPAPSNVSAPQ